MRVSLVHSPFGHKAFSENLRFVDEQFICGPPLMLAYVAGTLERAGHEVQIVDAHNLGLDQEQLLERLSSFGPDLLGLRLDTYTFHDQLETARLVKARLPGTRVLCGGLNLSLYPMESFSHGVFDYGLVGDADDRLVELLERIDAGLPAGDIPGAIEWNDGQVGTGPSEPGDLCPRSLDELPLPARHLLDNSIYHSVISQARNYTVMLASRGCPYRCNFCAISPLPYSTRSADSILGEIDQCYHQHGVRWIDFFDAVFFHDRRTAKTVFDELIRLKLDLQWSCRSRVDLVDDALLRKARKAGCKQIYFGIESGDPAVLCNIEKEIVAPQVSDALQRCRRAGIVALGFFMIGNRGETPDTVRRTLQFAGSLPLDYAQFCVAIAKPASLYDQERREQTGRDYWREYIAGTLPEQPFPRTWTELTEEETRRLARRGYASFYLTPRRIAAMLRRTRSLDELLRYVSVGATLLLATRIRSED